MSNEQDSIAKIFAAQITELAERSMKRQEPEWTDFLDPEAREQAQAILAWVTGTRFQTFGGYSKSERARLVIYPDYYLTETIEPALVFLEITVNSLEPLTHRDYLGALMGLGLKREKIGDLLVNNESCQVIMHPDLAEYVILNLDKVGNTKAKIKLIEPEQLNLPQMRTKEIRTTVASLRLDALAALGFGDSRTKMAREIKAERLKVNWKTVNDPDYQVNLGDIISMRGRGRVILQELTGRSKKGRLGVILVRFL